MTDGDTSAGTSPDAKFEAVSKDPKKRNLVGIVRTIERALVVSLTGLGAVWALELHHFAGISIFKEQVLGLVFALGLATVFLGVKPRAMHGGDQVPWYDWLLAGLALITGLYVTIFYRELVHTLGEIDTIRVALAVTAIVVVLEATRRMTGWVLIILALVCTSYATFSDYFPGVLNVPSSPPERIATYLYLDNNGIFGIPLDVTVSIIIAFILFGRMIYAANGAVFLTNIALATMGRYRGGPAKVAVLASSFFGTISGSVVSNVVMDGPITIPMMRKAGYPAPIAAAIEAVASTGGQIMPPVMGITAFLIAEYLAIPYGEVILAAFIPAVLYYVALFVQIDLEAAKLNINGLETANVPKLREAVKGGWVFLIPIVFLVYTLVWENWQPGRSAMGAVVATIVLARFHPATRSSWARIWDAVEQTGRTCLPLVAITAIAGLVIGTFQISTLSFNFSLILVGLADTSTLALLLMTAAVCIILGMGMPTGVIYIMLAVLVSPALIEMGIVPISAHLFLFYFGMLSMITPPICMATFAASTIAGSDFWETGWAGVRLGIAAYIVPFVMVYQPGLLFIGDWVTITLTVIKSLIGVAILAAGVVGYFYRPLDWGLRILVLASACVILLTPIWASWSAMLIASACLVVAGIGFMQMRHSQARNAAAQTQK